MFMARTTKGIRLDLGYLSKNGWSGYLRMTKPSPFCYFKTSPEIIRLAVLMYVWFQLSQRNVEDLLHERGIDISHESELTQSAAN